MAESISNPRLRPGRSKGRGRGRGRCRAGAIIPVLGFVVVALLAAGCGPDQQTTPGGSSGGGQTTDGPADPTPAPHASYNVPPGEPVVAQRIYVPVYSHIHALDARRAVDLTVTLSIRNTDPVNPITVTAVEYYDSAGKLVRTYGPDEQVMAPLASVAHVVEEKDRTGGVGANFLVGWQASTRVSPPIVEAVMISTASAQGISFTSRGEVIWSRGE